VFGPSVEVKQAQHEKLSLPGRDLACRIYQEGRRTRGIEFRMMAQMAQISKRWKDWIIRDSDNNTSARHGWVSRRHGRSDCPVRFAALRLNERNKAQNVESVAKKGYKIEGIVPSVALNCSTAAEIWREKDIGSS